MKKELYYALIAADQTITEKISYCEDRIENNYELLKNETDKETIEITETRIDFWLDKIDEYKQHRKTIRDFIDKNIK